MIELLYRLLKYEVKKISELIEKINQKLLGVEEGAQKNVIEGVTVGAEKLLVDKDKNVTVPVATLETAGVVKVGKFSNGLTIGDDGRLSVYGAEKSSIAAKLSTSHPITPYNLEYAVQVCTNQDSKSELTEAQLKLPPSTQFVKESYVSSSSSESDNGKFLQMVNGKATWVALTNAEEVAF